MIRPFTCICMLLAAGSGLYLYQTKHRAQLLDREIGRTIKQTEQARDRIGALKGEWALLSEPDRLTELTSQHLALKQLAPTQFVAMTDLASRLPAPLPPGTMIRPMDEPVPGGSLGAPVASAKPIAASPRVAEKPAERPTDKPIQMAALPQPALPQPALPPAAPAPKAAAKSPVAPPVAPLASTPAGAPAPAAPAAPRLASPAPMPAPMPAPRIMAPVMTVSAGQIPTPAPGSIGESVARANRMREQAAVVPAAAASAHATPVSVAPTYAPPGATALNGGAYAGSALGGAARVALPAPVPFGAGQR